MPCPEGHGGDVRVGSNPVIVVMSATRPLFLRKQTFVPDLAMSRKCQNRPDDRSKQRRYSITSSARASTVAGTSRPSALAVLRLMTNSNLVGCSIGRSAGLAPLRILSMK